MNDATMNNGVQVYPEIKLLEYVVNLCLTMFNNHTLFIVAAYLPASKTHGSLFLPSLANTCCFCFVVVAVVFNNLMAMKWYLISALIYVFGFGCTT